MFTEFPLSYDHSLIHHLSPGDPTIADFLPNFSKDVVQVSDNFIDDSKDASV